MRKRTQKCVSLLIFLCFFSNISYFLVDFTPSTRRVQKVDVSHNFFIPGRKGLFYDLEPAGPAIVKPVIPGQDVSPDILQNELIQAIVTPAIYAAMMAWAKVGSGQGLEREQVSKVKVFADGVAVYAAMNALMEIAEKYNLVFISESSEGKKDDSLYIPMGTIILGDGYIAPEDCVKILGKLPSTVGDVLEILKEYKQEQPRYIVAINSDPIEGTNLHVYGKKGSFSVIGATFYPVATPEEVEASKESQIHYVPDKGFYLAGYSWNSRELTCDDVGVADDPMDVLRKMAQERGSSGVKVAFLERGRHEGIKQRLSGSGLAVDLLTPKDGDAILRLLAVSGEVPELSPLLVTGASGTSEAAIAFKAAMMFEDGHMVLTYVPSTVNDTDLLQFLQHTRGVEKFTQDEIQRLEELGISPTHYLGEFDSDKAYLPPGAFNVVCFVPITGADPTYVGGYIGNLLPGIQTSIGVDNPAQARGITEPSELKLQALVATRLPGDEDGKIFVIELPFRTSNIGGFIGFVDNFLLPKIAQMVVDEESRRNVIPPIVTEK